MEIAFTSGGHQRLGWEWVLARALRGRGVAATAEGPGPLSGSTWPPSGGTPSGVPSAPGYNRSLIPAECVQTQPVLAGLAFGPALADCLRPAPTPRIWSRAVATLAPLIASFGDRIFHHALPLAQSAGLTVLGLHFNPSAVFWYPIFGAGLVLGAATASWRIGLRGEGAVLDLLSDGWLERVARRAERGGRLLLGLAAGWLLASAASTVGGGAALGSVALLALAAAVAWVRGLSPRARLAGLLLLGAAAGRWLA